MNPPKRSLLAVTCLLILGLTLFRISAQVAPPSADDTIKPELIGEGVVSTSDDEFGGSLSPDGSTLYYDVTVPAHYLYVICQSHPVNGKWQKPEVLSPVYIEILIRCSRRTEIRCCLLPTVRAMA